MQFHILTFLGKTWCGGERPEWPDETIIGFTRQIVEKGVAITFDVPIQKSAPYRSLSSISLRDRPGIGKTCIVTYCEVSARISTQVQDTILVPGQF